MKKVTPPPTVKVAEPSTTSTSAGDGVSETNPESELELKYTTYPRNPNYHNEVAGNIGKTLTGEQFNRIIGDEPMIKFTTESEVHNTYQLKTGLNVDTVPFYNKYSCSKGGIYFTSLYNFHMWVTYGNKRCVNFRYVNIPDNARVYVEQAKFKADKLILGPKMAFNELTTLWSDIRYRDPRYQAVNYFQNIKYIMKDNRFNMPEEYFLSTISYNPSSVSNIPESKIKDREFRMKVYDITPTPDTYNIFQSYMDDKSEKLYLLNKVPKAYEYTNEVDMCDPDFYTIGLTHNPHVIANIKQTSDMCKFAFEEDVTVFPKIKFYTDDMALEAVAAKPQYLPFIPLTRQTEAIALTAVQADGMQLQHVDNQTYTIAYEAVRQNGAAFKFVENQRPLTIIKNPDGTISQEYDDSIIMTALDTYPEAITDIHTFNEVAICKAISKKSELIKSIKPRWITDSIKTAVFMKSLKTGFQYFKDTIPPDDIVLSHLTKDPTCISCIPASYVFSQTTSEYIYLNIPEHRQRVIDTISPALIAPVVQDDILEALFSDSGLEAAKTIYKNDD